MDNSSSALHKAIFFRNVLWRFRSETDVGEVFGISPDQHNLMQEANFEVSTCFALKPFTNLYQCCLASEAISAGFVWHFIFVSDKNFVAPHDDVIT
jgi:hypothetical protein